MPDPLEPPAAHSVRFLITPFRVGWLVLSLWLFMLLGYGVDRPQFSLLLTLYALLFWGYSRITQRLWFADTPTPLALPPDWFLFGAAVLFRVALIAMVPTWSDDYARYLWDGHLVSHGANPYRYLPGQLTGTPFAQAAGLTDALFDRLPSPDSVSGSPPVAQGLFGAAAGLFPASELGFLLTLRLAVLLAELGTLWLLISLLRRIGQNPNRALLYALNPLVVLELTGNLHLEAIMIFFVLLAVWLFGRGHRLGSSVALTLGIGTNPLPLLLFPLLIRWLGWQRGLRYVAQTLVLTALLSVPLLDRHWLVNWLIDPNRLAQQPEFNASFYSLIRAVEHGLSGYSIGTQVGTGLWFVTLLSIVYVGVRYAARHVPSLLIVSLVLILSGYWLLSPDVPPRAIIPLLIPALFTPFRYPFVWSAAIVISYAACQTQPCQENGWFVALEYGLVIGYGLREWLRSRESQPSNKSIEEQP